MEISLSLSNAMERKIYVDGTYVVVRFRVSRAADGGESWVPIAKLGDSLWMGTVAASAVKAWHAITTMDSVDRMSVIVKSILPSASLSERGKIQYFE